jgi:parallel beta-helix repeat protein
MNSLPRRSFTLSAGLLVGAGATLAPAADPQKSLPPGCNIRDFGATGDGKSDDTAALQQAVARCPSGVLVFPAGDFRITKTIEIKGAQRGRLSLLGQGVGRVIMAGPGPAFRFSGSHTGSADPTSVKPIVWQKERMPLIDALEIVGDHAEADGVEFVQTMQPTLRSVLIRQVRHGVHLVKRNRNLLLDSCHIYQCAGVGVFLDRVNLHQAIIHGCHISYCKGGGIKIAGSEIRNLHITGNDIEYNYDVKAKESADVWIDITEGSVREGSIVSNTIQAKVSPGGANLRFSGPADINKVGLWTITGNHISNQTVNVHLKNCRGVVLTGNSLCLGQNRNILVEGGRHIVIGPHSLDHNPDYKGSTTDGITLRDCDGCIVTGVVVESSSAGSKKHGGSIEVLDSRETAILGCSVFEPGYRGIYVANSRNTRIADCTVMERNGAGKMLAAIEIAGKSPGSVVRGNIIGKGSVGDIIARGAAVEGNHPAAS